MLVQFAIRKSCLAGGDSHILWMAAGAIVDPLDDSGVTMFHCRSVCQMLKQSIPFFWVTRVHAADGVLRRCDSAPDKGQVLCEQLRRLIVRECSSVIPQLNDYVRVMRNTGKLQIKRSVLELIESHPMPIALLFNFQAAS